METLIFHGSPRENGDTAALLKLLQGALSGESRVVRAYDGGILPCIDCRACWERGGCAIKDGWQEVDAVLRRCDSVVIASPIYFSELTGPLLSVLSRLQQYYCATAFRGEAFPFKGKRGGLILTGGGDGGVTRAEQTALTLLHHMGCRELFPTILCHDTNRTPADKEPGVGEQITELGKFLEHRAS